MKFLLSPSGHLSFLMRTFPDRMQLNDVRVDVDSIWMVTRVSG